MKIALRVHEIWSGQELKGYHMTLKCDLDLESAKLTHRFCTSAN